MTPSTSLGMTDRAALVALHEARRQALADKGLITGETVQEQAADA